MRERPMSGIDISASSERPIVASIVVNENTAPFSGPVSTVKRGLVRGTSLPARFIAWTSISSMMVGRSDGNSSSSCSFWGGSSGTGPHSIKARPYPHRPGLFWLLPRRVLKKHPAKKKPPCPRASADSRGAKTPHKEGVLRTCLAPESARRSTQGAENTFSAPCSVHTRVVTFVCDRCAHCCRHHTVPVTHADVARLARHTGQSPDAFLDLQAPDSVDLTGEPETLVELPEGGRLVVLAHRQGGCVFLEKEGSHTETCSVHPHRPLACRAYPFDRSDDEAAPVGLHPAPLCPPETGYLTVLQKRESAASWQAIVRSRDRELHEYAEWVLRFNQRQRLRRRLGKRLRSRAELLRHLGEPVADAVNSGVVVYDALDAGEVAGAEQIEMNE